MLHKTQLIIKRSIDFLVSVACVILFLPVMILISIVVFTAMGSPVIFRQKRLGHKGRPFTLFKFRTMKTETAGQDNMSLPDEKRLESVGIFLRRFTLDEIPELFNVIKGDMSIIGPRPLLPEYRELYSKEQWRRHEVRPGMAGPVVAKGRNALDWEEKFKLDLWYVDNWSLWVDIKLFFRSFLCILRQEGVKAEGHATMPKFGGSHTLEGTR